MISDKVTAEQGAEICLLSEVSRLALGPTQSHLQWVQGALSLEMKL
jgi:hypothetical protein